MKTDSKNTGRKTVRVFFIGENADFYFKSKTYMSNYYVVGTKERLSMADFDRLLKQGFNVLIRPATSAEMLWAYQALDRTLAA